MTLELALIISLLLHVAGDYLFQNDWMAQNKTKSFLPAFVHATIYSLPFLILVPSMWWLLIWVTHLLIDRYRLAVYWIKLVNWNWNSKNFGYTEDKPAFLSVWLMIIIDNTFHLLFNFVAIILHYKAFNL